MSDDSDRRVRVDQLNAEAKSLRWLDYDRLQLLADEAFELACQKDADGDQYPYGMATALGLLADRNCIVGEWNIALSEASQALALLASQPVTPVMGWLYETVGWTRYFLGDYVLALDNLPTALSIAEETGDGVSRRTSLDRIASVQGSAGQLDVSLDTHERSLAMHRERRRPLRRGAGAQQHGLHVHGSGQTRLRAGRRRALAGTHAGGRQRPLLAGVYDTLAEVELQERPARGGRACTREKDSRPRSHATPNPTPATACSCSVASSALAATGPRRSRTGPRARDRRASRQCCRGVRVPQAAVGDPRAVRRHGIGALALPPVPRPREHEEEPGETESRLARLSVEHQVETARKDAEILRLRSLALEREVEERPSRPSVAGGAGVARPAHRSVQPPSHRGPARGAEHGARAWASRSLTMFDIDHFKSSTTPTGTRRATRCSSPSRRAPPERAEVRHAVPLGRRRVPRAARRHGRRTLPRTPPNDCARRWRITRWSARACAVPVSAQRRSREHDAWTHPLISMHSLAAARRGALRRQGGRPQPRRRG